jgi:small-conductance mechanosensitive channel
MKKLERPVLAEGEVTGHAHVLDGYVEVMETDVGTREFSLDKPTNLVHEEHRTITLPAKEMVSGICQEYSHFEEEAKQVRD